MLTSYLDFDPEDIENGGQSSDDEDVEKPDENAGREHYQAVGLVRNTQLCAMTYHILIVEIAKESSARKTPSP
jgi:uncharacterized DUF497 family protein